MLVTPLLLLLEAAIFFPEEAGGGCAVSAECLFFHASVFVTLRLAHAVIKGIGAENDARITEVNCSRARVSSRVVDPTSYRALDNAR